MTALNVDPVPCASCPYRKDAPRGKERVQEVPRRRDEIPTNLKGDIMVAPKEPSHMERYFAACHAMQSGVASELGYDETSGTPKHLRVGVNVAQTDLSSLVTLLIDLGVITLAQYECAIANGMEKEQKRYEELLSRHFGTSVKLA